MPRNGANSNTVTIAFGHGLAVAPLQAVMGISALVNGGSLIPPTFLKRSEAEACQLAKQVIKPETSDQDALPDAAQCREGQRLEGEREGLLVGGKTGTSEKGDQRPLCEEQAVEQLHGGAAGRQSALSGTDHAR